MGEASMHRGLVRRVQSNQHAINRCSTLDWIDRCAWLKIIDQNANLYTRERLRLSSKESLPLATQFRVIASAPLAIHIAHYRFPERQDMKIERLINPG
jgi:hypothetical protein